MTGPSGETVREPQPKTKGSVLHLKPKSAILCALKLVAKTTGGPTKNLDWWRRCHGYELEKRRSDSISIQPLVGVYILEVCVSAVRASRVNRPTD